LTTFIQSSHLKTHRLQIQVPDKRRGYQSNW
jgi:hypothetical protein